MEHVLKNKYNYITQHRTESTTSHFLFPLLFYFTVLSGINVYTSFW